MYTYTNVHTHAHIYTYLCILSVCVLMSYNSFESFCKLSQKKGYFVVFHQQLFYHLLSFQDADVTTILYQVTDFVFMAVV